MLENENLNEAEKPKLNIAAVSGSIFVENTYRPHIKQIRSKSNFFIDPISYKVTDEEIIFTKPTQMYNGKTIKPQKGNSGWWHFQIVAEEVPMKKFDFDDESTEDCVRIYYR